MNTLSAFPMGQANRDNPSMVFDWHKAAKLIKERKPATVSAGLRGDWSYTGGVIFEDGLPVKQEDTYVYLSSTWATPEICIHGETMDCFLMASDTDGWDSDTYWPESARQLLDAST